ncbi:TrkA C-terminal domain-containing protein [Mycoplasmatota bacterium WC30]
MKKVIEKIKYKFDQFLSLGTVALVLSLFLVMFIIVLLVGFIIFVFNPEFNLGSLIWISFMQTLDPGNLSGEQGSGLYMVLMTLATIVGIFITSLFISFILNGFQNRLEKLSRGRSKVIEKNHTLILGWNNNIYVLINELIEANRSIRKGIIVILSDMDSVEMNRNIKDNILKTYNTKIICRNGSIYKSSDLAMCNIVKAKSIIINQKDMNTIKSLLAIVNSEFYTNGQGHICALMYDNLNISVAKTIGKDKLEIVYLKSAITRIIAQTALQPGLSYVYSELLEFKGDEIYFYDTEEMIGSTFYDVIFKFEQAIVIGIMKDKTSIIKPSFDTIIEKGDRLILICEDEDTAIVDEEKHLLDESIIKNAKRKSSLKKEVVFVIGFNRKTKSVICEFNNYLIKGSVIKVLVNSEEYIQELNALNSELDNIEIQTFVGETFSREVLNTYLTKLCESVIIFANENVEGEEKDSQTLLTLLHLRDIEEIKQTKFDIIAEIADVRNSEIVDLAKVDDFIISELMANKMLAQISENRFLKDIFDHLLSDEGSEIYLKPIELYVDITNPVDFYTITESAIKKDEIPIGYRILETGSVPLIKLNPTKSNRIQFQKGDSLIVISED